MTVRPGLWANTPTNIGVALETDLANFGLGIRAFPAGVPCYAEDTQTLYIWDPQDTTSPSVVGQTVAVFVNGVQVGTWHAVSGGTVLTGALDTVVGATDSLKSTIPVINGVTVSVKGYTTPGDNGGGLFYWSATSTATDDSGTVIRPTAAVVGAWFRIYTGDLWVDWFGGKGNANFQNPADGKWYTTSGFVTEASDDMGKFVLALAAAISLGIKRIRIGAGNWYAAAKHGAAATPTSGNEFVRWLADGVDLMGEGTGNTFIRVSTGWNTVLKGGYSYVFGVLDIGGTDSMNNCKFSDFTVDHNGVWNGFYAANNTLNTSFAANAALGCSNGTNWHIDNCRSININGTFVYLGGAYGATVSCTNFSIKNCVLELFANDPNNVDASYIATGGRGYTIENCFLNGGLPFATGSLPFTPWSAFENHGRDFHINNNTCHDFNGGYLLGADSENLSDVEFSGNIGRNNTAGIELFQAGASNFERCIISDNVIEGGWFGLLLVHNGADNPGVMREVEICDNSFSNPTFHAGSNFGINILCAVDSNTLDGGLHIHNNHIVGYLDGGVTVGVSSNAIVANGIKITDNWIEQCGPNGVLVTAPAGGGAANVKGLFVDGNVITDSSGSMVYGVKVDAFCDASCIVGLQNKILGNTGNRRVFIDVSVYAGNAALYGIYNGQVIQSITDMLTAHPAVLNVIADLQTVNITTEGGDIFVEFDACANIDTAGGEVVFQIWLDGANTGPDAANNGTACQTVLANGQASASIHKRLTGIAPGAHVVKSRWFTTNGAVTAVINATAVPSFATLTVQELNR